MRFFAYLLLFAACAGKQLPTLSWSDPRLTPEARTELADAEDDLSVALARRDEARADAEAARAWAREVEGRLKGTDVGAPFGELGKARIALAESVIREAEARVDLARAREQRVRAEVLVRHALAAIDLGPWESAVVAREGELRTAERARAAAQAQAESAADTAWSAWSEAGRTSPPLSLFIP
jgi:hypothetical protein